MEFRDSETNEVIKAGDKVTLTFTFPEKLMNIGRADRILKELLEKNEGTIKKEEQ